MQTLDETLLYHLNDLSKNKKIYTFMSCITHIGDTEISVLYGIILLIVFQINDSQIALHALLAMGFNQILVQSIKRFVHRIRPFLTLNNLSVSNPPKCQYSFPSGHTASAVSMALGLGTLFPFLMPVWISLSILVGLSRMVLGYHYPTDVIVGATIALLTFII